MFDFSGFYDRMAKELPDSCKIAEVGVADGASSLYLANKLFELGKRFKLYMIDNLDYGKSEQLNTIISNVVKNGLGESIEIMALDSLNASCKFNDNEFDLIFIDASHLYEYTKADIRLWYKKVKDLGILSGHDANAEDVSKAVEEVIPTTIKRETLYHEDGEMQQEFDPEQFLHIEDTDKNYGVWWVRKDFYKKIN